MGKTAPDKNRLSDQMDKIFLLSLLSILTTGRGLKTGLGRVTCSPSDHNIHLSKSSHKTLDIQCSLTVDINSFPSFHWDIDKVRNCPKSSIRSQTYVTQNSTVKTIVIASEVFIDQKSSLMRSLVRLTLTASVDSQTVEDVVYRISCGSDSSLILICVFTAVGLVSILGAVLSLLVIKRRRHLQPAPVTQSVREDIWSDVDLSDNNGYTNQAFQGDMIDNLTSISNENFTDRPISRFISQISASRAVQDPEFLDADDLPCLRLATVALGGGADQGAGQLSVRDYEELEVVQEDLGSGYTTVRKIDSGEYGFLPTTSLILH